MELGIVVHICYTYDPSTEDTEAGDNKFDVC